jgi:hypothetical protein
MRQFLILILLSFFFFSAHSNLQFSDETALPNTETVPKAEAKSPFTTATAGVNYGSSSGSSTTVTHSSWFEEMADSFANVLMGIAFIFVMIPAIWFNERRTIKQRQIIVSGKRICLEPLSTPINRDSDGELVCIRGVSNNPNPMQDDQFQVVVLNSARLKRVVEVYQMRERTSSNRTRNMIGGGSTTTTTHTYEPVWSEDVIESRNFSSPLHRNDNDKVNFITKSKNQNADVVKLGDFFLNQSQIERMVKYESVPINQSVVTNLSINMRNLISTLPWVEKTPLIEGPYIMLKQSQHVSGQQIGDIRISFEVVKCGPLTVVCEQAGQGFVPYEIARKGFKRSSKNEMQARLIDGDERTSTCDCFDTFIENACVCCFCCCKCMSGLLQEDKTIDWVFESGYNKDTAFEAKLYENKTTTLLIRIGGWLGLIVGFALVLSPVVTFFSIVAIFGSAVSVAAWAISIVFGSSVYIITLSLAWIAHRPLVAIPLLLIASTVTGLLLYYQNAEIQTNQ